MHGKNRVMSDKNCFTTDAFVRREVKFFFISYRHHKTQKHSVSIDLSCFIFSFYEHFNRQFTYAVFLHSKLQDVFE